MLRSAVLLPRACFTAAARVGGAGGYGAGARDRSACVFEFEYVFGADRFGFNFKAGGSGAYDFLRYRRRGVFQRRLDYLQFYQRGSCVAAAVFAGVGLDRRLQGPDLRLGSGVVGLAGLAQERRDGDRCEDADDQDDNQELDEGKPTLI